MSAARKCLQRDILSLAGGKSGDKKCSCDPDTALEYLCSLDCSAADTKEEMILFLGDCFGRNKEGITRVVENFLRLNLQQGQQPASCISQPSPLKKTQYQPKSGKEMSGRAVCGCMAVHHAFASSCISCGRIHCVKEKIPTNNCIFCNAFLESDVSASAASKLAATDMLQQEREIAYALKDKLLLFDKECAKRTKVLDSQGDYYDTDTWLSEEEKRDMDDKEKKRREKLRRRPKGRMVTSFDVAGRKTVEYISSEEEDETGEISPAAGEKFTIENITLASTSGKTSALYSQLRKRLSEKNK